MEKVIAEHQPDVIINAAAYTAVRQSRNRFGHDSL
ncbi:hypothetical protein RS130_20870 [Paraglaciecola aquimarina]|uniref:Uncharacterized protein n=1 Tax=Paraglaciecola aquimarina TaxID=1235557 RepID=A0ABU3T1B1_9ALTE|nr:hypothetical protein [Paraglaciecola aquimarina]MDU0356015.1 hypothetical protein [Paraglaciecola aquimarina]